MTAAASPTFVSMVIPTFRRPEALRATLESVMAIDYPADAYEVIVVDDGSGDRTPEVVRSFERPAPRVRCVEQPNSGVARARNQGAALATGELLIFLDD